MLEEHLQTYFGFATFKEGQREVVTRLMAGLTLVVSPLLALMKDQVEFLQGKGIPAARLDSTLDRQAFLQVMDDARQGRLKILKPSPCQLLGFHFRTIPSLKFSSPLKSAPDADQR